MSDTKSSPYLPDFDQPAGNTSLPTPRVRPGPYRGEDYQVDDAVGYLMKQVVESIREQIDVRMGAYGITDAQWRPLVMMCRHGCRTAADLARATHGDTGAVTRMLDRLEEKGLLHRSRSAEDRRVQRLELTAEGQRLAAIVPYVIADVLNAHLAGVRADELDLLKDLLRRMLAAGQSESGRLPAQRS